MQISVTPVMEFEGAAVIFLFLPTMSCSDSILLIKSTYSEKSTKVWRNLQTSFIRYLVSSKKVWRVLHIFVVLSEYINFMTLAEFGMKQQNYHILIVNLNWKITMKWIFIYKKHFNWTFNLRQLKSVKLDSKIRFLIILQFFRLLIPNQTKFITIQFCSQSYG